MLFEFLIVCRVAPEHDVRRTLIELLARELEDNQPHFNESVVPGLIVVSHQRVVAEGTDEAGEISRHALIGFSIDLPDDIGSIQAVMTNFTRTLSETPPISHVLKFEDPLRKTELAERAAELYALEMKLRRVLSLIYLNAYQDDEPYNLLREEKTQIPSVQRPQEVQMKAASENQFFHLTFSQYADLNQRRSPNWESLLYGLRGCRQFDDFRSEMLRVPIEREEDATFMTDLKELLGSIEEMRNSVAHNRRPTGRVTDSYPTALKKLEERLDEYLMGWEVRG